MNEGPDRRYGHSPDSAAEACSILGPERSCRSFGRSTRAWLLRWTTPSVNGAPIELAVALEYGFGH